MWSYDLSDHNSPISDAPGVLANSYKATGQVRVYGFSVYNSLTATQYILMFDSSTLPADAAVPLETFTVQAQSNLGLYYGEMGRLFRRGIILCNSTTDTTKTIGAANCLFDVEYDALPTIPRDMSGGAGQ